METVYDVRQLLKRFGIFVYIGDRLADLELIELEITELYEYKFIAVNDYQKALLILRRAKNEHKKNRGKLT